MKKVIVLIILFVCIATLCSCSTNRSSEIEQARNAVIEKWRRESGKPGTSKFIEDTYTKFPDDDVISNIYFYCIAKEWYGYYASTGSESELSIVKEYAAKIDPNYSKDFSKEMHEFVEKVIPVENIEAIHNEFFSKEKEYNSLTKSEKKEICNYIQERYNYYDAINGGKSGNKFSDIIMQEAADKYNLSVTQIGIIWANLYSY